MDVLSTEHPEKLVSRALSPKRGLRIYVEEKIALCFYYESGVGSSNRSGRATLAISVKLEFCRGKTIRKHSAPCLEALFSARVGQTVYS
jgi:hypothetical protein